MTIVHDAFQLVIENIAPIRSRTDVERRVLIPVSHPQLIIWTWADLPIAEVIRSRH